MVEFGRRLHAFCRYSYLLKSCTGFLGGVRADGNQECWHLSSWPLTLALGELTFDFTLEVCVGKWKWVNKSQTPGSSHKTGWKLGGLESQVALMNVSVGPWTGGIRRDYGTGDYPDGGSAEAVARKAVNQERRWTRHTLHAGEGEELDILRAGNEALLADRQAPERQVRSLREGVSELREVERERVGEMNWPV